MKLIGLGPASRVFTCPLLDRLLTASTPYIKMPHTASYCNNDLVFARSVLVALSLFPQPDTWKEKGRRGGHYFTKLPSKRTFIYVILDLNEKID